MTSQRFLALPAIVTLVAVGVSAPFPAAAAKTPAPAPVLQESRESKSFAIMRSAGTCPKTVTLATYVKGYEGGADIEITVRTNTFAAAPHTIVKRPSRIEFVATKLKPDYADCEATARFSNAANQYQLALHSGGMKLVILPSAELTMMGTSVTAGNPIVKFGVAD
jgi:hypothetical protein